MSPALEKGNRREWNRMKKVKKLLTFAVGAAMLASLCSVSAFAEETTTYLEPSEPKAVTIGSTEVLFANGTPVTIVARTDGQEGALVKWGTDGELAVGKNVTVFGGSHNHDGIYESTSIVMEGGTVRNLVGGGLHKSHVKTANVEFKGGTAVSVQGGGASSFVKGCGDDCDYTTTWYAGDPKESPCVVDETNVIISGGKITSLVFGGGEGISCTKVASLAIAGGDMSTAWVTAGGSNGYTGTAAVAVADGQINVLQGVNRGSMDASVIVVMGGSVDKMYLGGETGDASVTGTVAAVGGVVMGGEVKELHPGTTGGTEITPDTEDIEVAVAVAPEATVGNSADLADAFGADAVRTVYTVTYKANNGEDDVVLPTISGELVEKPEDPAKEGFTFKGWFSDEALTKAYTFEEAVTGDLVLYAKWEAVASESNPSTPSTPDNSKPENPTTGSTSMVWVVLAAALAGAASVVMIKSRRVRSK